MNRITITHLARNLADIVNRVLYRGERFVVTRGDRPAVELVPPPRSRKVGELPEIFARLPRLPEGDADAWSSELAEARRDVGPPPEDPWDS